MKALALEEKKDLRRLGKDRVRVFHAARLSSLCLQCNARI